MFFEREVLRITNVKFTQLYTATDLINFVIYQLKLKFRITNNENLNNNHKL